MVATCRCLIQRVDFEDEKTRSKLPGFESCAEDRPHGVHRSRVGAERRGVILRDEFRSAPDFHRPGALDLVLERHFGKRLRDEDADAVVAEVTNDARSPREAPVGQYHCHLLVAQRLHPAPAVRRGDFRPDDVVEFQTLGSERLDLRRLRGEPRKVEQQRPARHVVPVLREPRDDIRALIQHVNGIPLALRPDHRLSDERVAPYAPLAENFEVAAKLLFRLPLLLLRRCRRAIGISALVSQIVQGICNKEERDIVSDRRFQMLCIASAFWAPTKSAFPHPSSSRREVRRTDQLEGPPGEHFRPLVDLERDAAGGCVVEGVDLQNQQVGPVRCANFASAVPSQHGPDGVDRFRVGDERLAVIPPRVMVLPLDPHLLGVFDLLVQIHFVESLGNVQLDGMRLEVASHEGLARELPRIQKDDDLLVAAILPDVGNPTVAVLRRNLRSDDEHRRRRRRPARRR